MNGITTPNRDYTGKTNVAQSCHWARVPRATSLACVSSFLWVARSVCMAWCHRATLFWLENLLFSSYLARR